jgi:catechol 2,3-dioxygenase-like lactoylglutathione lyase family enzyme
MITVVVDDYDSAIDYYTTALGFTLVEDTKMSDVSAGLLLHRMRIKAQLCYLPKLLRQNKLQRLATNQVAA